MTNAPLPPLLYRGSAKDVLAAGPGQAPYIFAFTDRYSVFDWGEMPDRLPDKGRSLCLCGAIMFALLAEADGWRDWIPPATLAGSPALARLRTHGLRHHVRSALDANATPVDVLTAPDRVDRYLAVEPVDVLWPSEVITDGALSWSYAAYQDRPVNALVPLEIIFRFGAPAGSSVFERLGDPAYRATSGLDTSPQPGARFLAPIIEFSTKLEPTDRYLTRSEAQSLAGLTAAEMSALTDWATLLAWRLHALFSAAALQLWDGKIECSFVASTDDIPDGPRDFMLVDSIGPDELRLTHAGQSLSKQNLRGCYLGTPWKAAVDRAKALAQARGVADWQAICRDEPGTTPPLLAAADVQRDGDMYQSIVYALAHKHLGRAVFQDCPDLATISRSLAPDVQS